MQKRPLVSGCLASELGEAGRAEALKPQFCPAWNGTQRAWRRPLHLGHPCCTDSESGRMAGETQRQGSLGATHQPSGRHYRGKHREKKERKFSSPRNRPRSTEAEWRRGSFRTQRGNSVGLEPKFSDQLSYFDQQVVRALILPYINM